MSDQKIIEAAFLSYEKSSPEYLKKLFCQHWDTNIDELMKWLIGISSMKRSYQDLFQAFSSINHQQMLHFYPALNALWVKRMPFFKLNLPEYSEFTVDTFIDGQSQWLGIFQSVSFAGKSQECHLFLDCLPEVKKLTLNITNWSSEDIFRVVSSPQFAKIEDLTLFCKSWTELKVSSLEQILRKAEKLKKIEIDGLKIVFDLIYPVIRYVPVSLISISMT